MIASIGGMDIRFLGSKFFFSLEYSAHLITVLRETPTLIVLRQATGQADYRLIGICLSDQNPTELPDQRRRLPGIFP